MPEPGIDTPDDPLEFVIGEEHKSFLARQALLGAREPSGQPSVGLALSGGGIRSATFSLGLLQSLSKNGLIPKIDYLSTVSGGSYIGAFLGALFINPAGRFPETKSDEEKQECDDSAADQSVRHAFLTRPLQSERGVAAVATLREFGRYLTPGGTSDTLLGIATTCRNWAATQFVLGLLPLALFLGVELIARLCGTQAKQTFGAIIFLSALAAMALGAAYWFTRRESVPVPRPERILTNFMVLLSAALSFGSWRLLANIGSFHTALSGLRIEKSELHTLAYCSLATLTSVLSLGLAVFLYHELRYGKAKLEAGTVLYAAALEAEDQVRSRVSRNMATASLLTVVLSFLFLVWLLGGYLAEATLDLPARIESCAANFDVYVMGFWSWCLFVISQFWPFILPFIPLALTLWANQVLSREGSRGFLITSGGQTILGISILLFWLVVWSSVAQIINLGRPSSDFSWANFDPEAFRARFMESLSGDGVAKWLYDYAPQTWAMCIVILMIGGISLAYTFLNLSSLTTFYSARLKRAYIGASNPNKKLANYDQDQLGDQVPMSVYYPKDGSLGGPIHLINVTIAQTVSEGSNVVAYDRKGKPMHIGPAGIVYEGDTPGTIVRRDFSACEELSLSTWTAISGAAASTALGSLTSIGLSILAMMTNVRLGYWWKANTSRMVRSFGDNVYGYLLAELQGKFAADNRRRRWYLTDGGHFDNSGVYALLQRRLPFIIMSDNGADPAYRMADVNNLLVRARIDLGVEIEFLEGTALRDKLGTGSGLTGWIGDYRTLATVPARGPAEVDPGGPYAALAKITYPAKGGKPRKTGLLLLIKPRLCGKEVPEILHYRDNCGDGDLFPQQSTLDQFFDEVQWEAYRRFGEVLGDKLFAKYDSNGDGWTPHGMSR